MMLLSAASVAGFVWFVELLLTRRSGPVDEFVVSGLLLAGSLGLFCWTLATTRRRLLGLACGGDAPASLHRRGPFEYVRHPLYTSYLVFWSAGAIAAGGLFWIVPLAMGVVYSVIARGEERGFEMSPLAAGYRAYREETGMFFPRVTVRGLQRALGGVP